MRCCVVCTDVIAKFDFVGAECVSGTRIGTRRGRWDPDCGARQVQPSPARSGQTSLPSWRTEPPVFLRTTALWHRASLLQFLKERRTMARGRPNCLFWYPCAIVSRRGARVCFAGERKPSTDAKNMAAAMYFSAAEWQRLANYSNEVVFRMRFDRSLVFIRGPWAGLFQNGVFSPPVFPKRGV